MREMKAGGGVRLGVGCGLAVAMLAGVAMCRLPAVSAQNGYAQDANANLQLAAQVGELVDPPSRVARVSVLLGNVSVEPGSVNQFSAAEANYPMTTGDRIYADTGANAELQTGQLAVRMGQQTDLTVTAMTDTLAQFGLAQGSVHLRSFALEQGETVELDTPNVAITMLQPGDVRVDVDANSNTTVVSLLSGQAEVDGNGLQQVLEAGERVKLGGSDPVYAQWLGRARLDGLDRFSTDRDGIYETALASEDQYVNPGTIGAEDLQGAGQWDSDPEYGAVWYPTAVSVGWQPYSCGHWAWVAPWGWTWVECESWGFAPFHYGRWNRFGSRWGWIPGPPVVRPIYSPGLVVFVGGPKRYTGGVAAWFPLGPREVYQPWYSASPRYVNRVNVSNIYNRNTVEVRNVYNSRTAVNVYNTTNIRNVYVNRQVATVAVSQENFAKGRAVQSSMVRVDAREMAAAPVVPHPMITPERPIVTPSAPHAVPTRMERPVLASRVDTRVNTRVDAGGQQPAGQQSGGQRARSGAQFGGTVQAPAQPVGTQPGSTQPAPVQRTPVMSGRPAPAPAGAQEGNMERGGYQGQGGQGAGGQGAGGQGAGGQGAGGQSGGRQTAVGPVEQRPAPMQPQPRVTTPEVPVGGVPVAPGGGPIAPGARVFGGPRQAVPQAGNPAESSFGNEGQQQRPLFNRAVPPETRPSFDQQQRAIQSTDPGRPLSPRQMDNVRQSQPAGPAQQREQPHPAAAPPPQRAAPPAAAAPARSAPAVAPAASPSKK